MSTIASQITGVSVVCSAVCSGADQRKRQISRSLAFVRGIHRWPVNSPHKGPGTWKMFPFDDVIMAGNTVLGRRQSLHRFRPTNHKPVLPAMMTSWAYVIPVRISTVSWWRHQIETFSAYLAICAGNSPVPGKFPAQSDAELWCFFWSAPE